MTTETVTPTEPRTITTMRVDQLQPGDVVRLLYGVDCAVAEIEPRDDNRYIVVLAHPRIGPTSAEVSGVWLWKYSRVEVLSDVSGRGHLVTPMHTEPESY